MIVQPPAVEFRCMRRAYELFPLVFPPFHAPEQEPGNLHNILLPVIPRRKARPHHHFLCSFGIFLVCSTQKCSHWEVKWGAILDWWLISVSEDLPSSLGTCTYQEERYWLSALNPGLKSLHASSSPRSPSSFLQELPLSGATSLLSHCRDTVLNIWLEDASLAVSRW